MVLPTERDQRDMSMRRHKLFFLFFFSEFFFGGFLKVSFVSTRHYQMCTTTSNECLNRLSEDFLSLYTSNCVCWIFFSKFLSEIQTEIEIVSVFIRLFLFCFVFQKQTERQSLLYFLGFVLFCVLISK